MDFWNPWPRRSCFLVAYITSSVFYLVVDHACHVPWRRIASEEAVEPVEVGVVVERHRLHGVGPVAVVGQHNQARRDVKRLQCGEVLQALVVRHAVVTLASDDERGGGKFVDVARR